MTVADFINSVSTDNKPLAGWAIVISNGVKFIGQLHTNHQKQSLSPAFELVPHLQQQRGGAQPIYVVLPVCLLNIKRIDIPDGAIVIKIESLSYRERSTLRDSVDAIAPIVQQMNEADGGIIKPTTAQVSLLK